MEILSYLSPTLSRSSAAPQHPESLEIIYLNRDKVPNISNTIFKNFSQALNEFEKQNDIAQKYNSMKSLVAKVEIVDFDDVVIRGVTVIRAGEITWPAPPIQVSAQPQAAQKAAQEVKTEEKCACSPWRKYALMALAIILFGWLASVAPKEFLGHFTVFALACVVGYYVVWNVSHALHTPLMSVTNAISGIIVVGALLQIGQGGWVSFLSFIAVLIASINIFGGFTVTQRMLKMFRKN